MELTSSGLEVRGLNDEKLVSALNFITAGIEPRQTAKQLPLDRLTLERERAALIRRAESTPDLAAYTAQ